MLASLHCSLLVKYKANNCESPIVIFVPCLKFPSYSSNLGSGIRARITYLFKGQFLMCSSSSSGRTSDEPITFSLMKQ